MSFRVSNFWDDQRIQRLEFLWSEEWTCREIAADLGCTRSAVIGKVDRLNLPARGPKQRMTPEEARRRRLERQAKYDAKRNNRPFKYTPRIIMDAPQLVPVPEYEGYLGIPFCDLKPWRGQQSNECRFIASHVITHDVPACGSAALPGASYCPHCIDLMKPKPQQTQAERSAMNSLRIQNYHRSQGKAA